MTISLADDPPDFSMHSHAFKNGFWLSGMLENNMILDIIDAIPKAVVSSIHTLALNHDATETDCDHGCQGSFSDIPQHYIPEPFRRFSGVTTLHLRRQGNETFPDMLSSSLTGDWLFPALHTLVIIMVEPVERSWWSSLCTVLAARQAAGKALARLIVRGRACHAYGANDAEDEFRATVEGYDNDIAQHVWMEHCKVTLEDERLVVGEVVDERDGLDCDCGRWVML
ncbi:hypothetical protein PENSPDRAFT_669805 [Peniophora sp. CONT]|nr:hypothetical protein PENSPDRAFT_669805 [Peniophora sp. CONT]